MTWKILLFIFSAVYSSVATPATIYLASPYWCTLRLPPNSCYSTWVTWETFQMCSRTFPESKRMLFPILSSWGTIPLYLRAHSLSVFLTLSHPGGFNILLIWWVESSLCDSSSTVHYLKPADSFSTSVMWTLLIVFIIWRRSFPHHFLTVHRWIICLWYDIKIAFWIFQLLLGLLIIVITKICLKRFCN